MIPDFKTFLKESIWSDMQDRGTGDIIKTEDISSINNMKKDKFFDFLCNRYKQVSGEKWFNRDYYQSTISFPVFSTKDDNEEFSVFITGFRDITKSVYVRDNFILNASDMLKKLQDNFTVDIVYKDDTEPDWAEIYPKDQSEITNYFFVTVVDFLIDNVDTNKYKRMQERSGSLKESIWSDMQDRGTGDMVKREDDVNLLDTKDFYDYILKRYKLLDSDVKANCFVMTHQTDISMPIYMDKSTLHLSGPIRDSFTFHLHFEMKDNGKKEITMDPTIVTGKYSVDFTTSILYKKLFDEFYVYKKHHMGLQMIHIEPKDGRNVDNMFYLKVLDFITDNYDESEHKIIGKA